MYDLLEDRCVPACGAATRSDAMGRMDVRVREVDSDSYGGVG